MDYKKTLNLMKSLLEEYKNITDKYQEEKTIYLKKKKELLQKIITLDEEIRSSKLNLFKSKDGNANIYSESCDKLISGIDQK